MHRYASQEDEFARRRTRRVMAQFTPCVLVGAAITAAVAHVPEFTAFLPGVWGMVFGLGLVATRPYLPPGVGLVGLGYVITGTALVLRTMPIDEPSGWAVGGPFGVGHLLTAVVLCATRPRESDHGN